MMDGLGNRNEQFQAFAHGQLVFIAKLRDRHAPHQFHHEEFLDVTLCGQEVFDPPAQFRIIGAGAIQKFFALHGIS